MQAKRKRNNMAGLKIVVAGCVAAQEGEALLRRVPELDLVLGPHHANRCPSRACALCPLAAMALAVAWLGVSFTDNDLSWLH